MTWERDSEAPITEHDDVMAAQDVLLVGMTSTTPRIDQALLRRLPPWRAVMIARLATRANLMTAADRDEIVREARLEGGTGVLRPWSRVRRRATT